IVLLELGSPEFKPGKRIAGISLNCFFEVVAGRRPLLFFHLLLSLFEVLPGIVRRPQRGNAYREILGLLVHGVQNDSPSLYYANPMNTEHAQRLRGVSRNVTIQFAIVQAM